jgi:alpha-beta hydrolase superfamily lysophospholipase
MPTAESVRRLEGWLRGEGARLERIPYLRPAARGEVEAWRLVPRAPRARVVAVHGAGNDAFFPLVALFKALIRQGVEVFSFDVDGHGAASTTVFSPDAVLSAVPAAVERAEAGSAPLPLHLLGHSLGGSLVLHALANDAFLHVASAIAVSAPISIHLDARVAASELRGFFRALTLGQREHYGAWGVIPAVGPLRRRAYPVRGAVEPGVPFAYVDAVRDLLERLDLDDAAQRVRAPVLLVYGARDLLVPVDQGRRLAERIPAAELVEVVDATHWSTVFAAETVARVASWVDAHTAVPA